MATLFENISSFMATYVATNLYDDAELERLLSLVQRSENAQEINTICALLFRSDWIFMPLALASAVTNRLIEIGPDQKNAKLLRGQWLLLFGREHENDEEGIKLLQHSEEGRRMLAQATAELD